MGVWLWTEDGQLVNSRHLRIIEKSGDKILGYFEAGQVTLRRAGDEGLNAVAIALEAKRVAPGDPQVF